MMVQLTVRTYMSLGHTAYFKQLPALMSLFAGHSHPKQQDTVKVTLQEGNVRKTG